MIKHGQALRTAFVVRASAAWVCGVQSPLTTTTDLITNLWCAALASRIALCDYLNDSTEIVRHYQLVIGLVANNEKRLHDGNVLSSLNRFEPQGMRQVYAIRHSPANQTVSSQTDHDLRV